MKFKSLVDKFRKAQDQIRELGTDIVDVYPNSERLATMTQEIATAVEALDTLAATLEEALQEAEQDEALFKSLMDQMEESDLYSKLKPEERKRLAEYLVQAKTGLASPEVLIGYVEKSLNQKSESELIGMYPKATILKRGQQMDDGSDAFDAYTAGLNAYRSDFGTDREKAIKDLSKVWLNRGMEAIVREFYKEALKPKDKDDTEVEDE